MQTDILFTFLKRGKTISGEYYAHDFNLFSKEGVIPLADWYLAVPLESLQEWNTLIKKLYKKFIEVKGDHILKFSYTLSG